MPKTTKRPRKKPPEPTVPKAMGRPTKFVPTTIEAIVTMVAGGMSYKDAARANGVSESLFHEWQSRGRAAVQEAELRTKKIRAALVAECKTRGLAFGGSKQEILARLENADHPFVDFVERLEKAEAERKFVWLGKIESAEDWKAKAWLLERLYPNEFSRQVRLAGHDGGAIEIENLPADVRAAMREKLDEIAERKRHKPKLIKGGKVDQKATG